MTTDQRLPVAVLGAGPYGLAVAAHLREAGVPLHVFGEPMSYWERNMPAGMRLRSSWRASWISSPGDRHSLPAYERHIGRALDRPVPINDFIAYGHWFQEQVVPDVDRRRVMRLRHEDGAFRFELEDGDEVTARRVVLATGLEGFTRRPAPFDGLDPSVVSHTADHHDLGVFAGRRVLVVGAGQSAIESGALAREAGADVQVLERNPQGIHWLTRSAKLHRGLGVAGRLFYAPTDVGPAGMSWVVATPRVMRRLPVGLRARMARRCLRPAASDWLIARLGDAPVTHGAAVAARTGPDGVTVELEDGSSLQTDHVLLGTGFAPDVRRIAVLDPELMDAVETVSGMPVLRRGFETSVPGLHVVGALAAHSFGPVMRFVSGTWSTAPAVARVIARSQEPGAGPAAGERLQHAGASRG